MNDQTREHLLGYLLGALDESEREDVERQLTMHPDWQRELQSLMTGLEPLAESYRDLDPPHGLADRTCALIAERCEQARVAPAQRFRQPPVRYAMRRANRWTMADVVVVAGICLAAAFLFFPAVAQSRYQSRLMACQNNLRHLGISLVDYSEKKGAGYFPEIPTNGHRAVAGIYAPMLIDAGYLTDPNRVICPGSLLGRNRGQWQLPTLRDIDQATGPTLLVLQQSAGGAYGYSLGVVVDGKHRAPKNQGRTHFALMSDAPTFWTMDHHTSNHEGHGQNILYEDGHVEFVTKYVLLDHPFENRRGSMEAGMDANDAVIAPSQTPPFARLAAAVALLQ